MKRMNNRQFQGSAKTSISTSVPFILSLFHSSTSHKLIIKSPCVSSFLILHIHFRNIGKETLIPLQTGSFCLPQPPSKAVVTTSFCLLIGLES